MRWFTWIAVLGPLGPHDIPQASPLPVAEKIPSQCSRRPFHCLRVQGLRRTSQSGACASPVLSRPPQHNAVTTPRTISPSSPQEGGSSPRDTQMKYKHVRHTKWNANKYTSLSPQEPACKYSSNGVPEGRSTLLQLHWSLWKCTGTAGIDTSQSTPREFSCRRYCYRPKQKNRRQCQNSRGT